MTEMTQIKRRIEVAAQEAAAEMDRLAEDNRGLRGFIERVRNAARVDHGVDLVGFVAAMHAVYVREHVQPQPMSAEALLSPEQRAESDRALQEMQRARSVRYGEPQPPAPQPMSLDGFGGAGSANGTNAPQPAAEGPIKGPVTVEKVPGLGLQLLDRGLCVNMNSKAALNQIAAALNAQPAAGGTESSKFMAQRLCVRHISIDSADWPEGLCEDIAKELDKAAAGGGGKSLTDAQIEEIATEHAGEYHSLALMLIREALLRARLRGDT